MASRPTIMFVATGRNYPDAPAASAAAAGEAPVLLVSRDAVPDVVRDELARLRPYRIVLLGGEGAISASVADAVQGRLR